MTKALVEAGWSFTASDIGFRGKNPMSLAGEPLTEVEASLDVLDGDVHRIYAALT